MRYIISLSMASAIAFSSAAHAEVPRVVTDIPPVHSLVAQVMGDLGAPVLLLEKGADEHDFALRPSQMRDISGAGLVVWIGPSLTPWLDRALTATPAPSLTLLDAAGTQGRSFATDAALDQHDSHDTGLDPHAWLNPENAGVWLGLIATRLTELDPDNSATYAKNAALAQDRVKLMDAKIASLLAPVKTQHFVTFHAAYGYFTAHFGLTGADALALGDAAAPGAARVAALSANMQADQYLCAFPEIQHDPALLTQIMAGSTTKLGAPLDPVGSSLDVGPDAYEALMTTLAENLRDCLQP